jgi:AraC family transcriptional regulator
LDPVVAHLVNMIVAAAVAGAPELYAESATQFLAMHLLRLQSGWPAREDGRKAGTLSRSRLAHVIAFMRANYMHAPSPAE